MYIIFIGIKMNRKIYIHRKAVQTKMKILVVFTGGTIGSTFDSGIIYPDNRKERLLLEMYNSQNDSDAEFISAEPYYTLSENSTGETLSNLIAFICGEINKNFDGIIVTCGTDTLQYSAAALSYTLGLNCKPVVLVSSNYVLTDRRANGLENFSRAVDFIRGNHGTGVFVSYKNSDGKSYIHRASRIMAHHEYSDDIFSVKNLYYGSFSSDSFIKNPDYSERQDEIEPFGKITLQKHSSGIAVIQPYVGIDFHGLNQERAVLIKTYHSGTLCTEDESFAAFADRLRDCKIPCFICGAETSEIYESEECYGRYGFKIIPRSSFISQYIKLWLAQEKGLDFCKIFNKSLGGDLMP